MEIENYLKSNISMIDRQLERTIPKNFDSKWLNHILGRARWEHDAETCTKSIAAPTWDLLSRGGKRWRPSLMLLSYQAVGGNGTGIDKLLALPELIHNGTLMVDDVEDDSDMRRGRECIHKVYGQDIAINTGNSLYYLPCMLVTKDRSIEPELKVKIYDLIMEEMTRLSFGQAMDIYWHKGMKSNVTEEHYLQMCSYKTGTLARMAAKLGALLGNATRKQVNAIGMFAESIGVAFQIQDDILNITNKEWGKDFGEDITEGKRTLMVICVFHIGSEEDKHELLRILSLKTKNKKLIKRAIAILKKYESIDYAKEKAKSIVAEAWGKLDPIIKHSDSKDKLKLFADFVINREI